MNDYLQQLSKNIQLVWIHQTVCNFGHPEQFITYDNVDLTSVWKFACYLPELLELSKLYHIYHCRVTHNIICPCNALEKNSTRNNCVYMAIHINTTC